MKKKLSIIIFFLFICSVFLTTPIFGSTVVITGYEDKVDLYPHLYIYEDAPENLSFNNIINSKNKKLFKLNLDGIPDYGFNDKVYWFRFTAENKSGSDKTLFLELAYPHMNKMELYCLYQDGSKKEKVTGDIFPFKQRDIQYRNIVNELTIPKNETATFYVRFSGKCSKNFPLILWSPIAFSEMVIEEKYGLGIYYGIILVMALYNLFLFFFVRDKSYLYYVIYILMYGLVQIAYNGMAFKYLWPSFPHWHNISLPFLIGLTVLFMVLFAKEFLHCREYSKILDKILISVMALSAFVMLFAPFGNYIWAIQFAMLLMVLAAVVVVTSGFITLKMGYRPARFFIIAWGAFLLGMVLIPLNKLNIIESNFFTEYAIQIGSALEVTLLSLALADRINVMDKEKKQVQLEKLKAQEKYKKLVEGSKDIIFSLDETLHFTAVNRAVKEHFKVTPDSLIGKNFFDQLYERDNEESMSSHFVSEKIDLLKKEKDPISFNAEFKTPLGYEPKEMQVKLEYLTADGKNEILGKASAIQEDALLKYFTCEKQQFTIGNYFLIADDITQRITRNLLKFMDARESNLVRIAIREIIINAIEHGNLNIKYEEKTNALINESYFNFIASRRENPQYRNRKVHIVYSINAEKAVFKVTDEGDGFDYEKFLKDKSDEANEELLPHGRGLTLAKSIFDSIEFNQKGNQILLLKLLNNNEEKSQSH